MFIHLGRFITQCETIRKMGLIGIEDIHAKETMSLNEVKKGGFFPQIELNQSWFKGKGTERIDGDSAGGTFFIPCGDDGYARSKP